MFKAKLIYIVFLISLLCFPLTLTSEPAFAEVEVNEEVILEEDPKDIKDQTDVKVNPTDDFTKLPVLIEEKWSEVLAAINTGNLQAVNTGVFELESLRNRAGFKALESYSLRLIDAGLEALEKRDIDTAAFYTRKTLQLSPDAPRVLFRSLPLVHETRVVSSTSQLLKAIGELFAYPHLILEIARSLIYPLLWAFTIGLYLSFIVLFVSKAHEALRVLARKLPMSLRGIFAPLLLLAMLCLPCFFGPLWTLFVWSLVVFLFHAKKKWLVFLTGTLLALWGFSIQIRENLTVWIRDEGIQSMLKVYSGTFDQTDRENLEALVDARPDDGAAFYVLGQVQKKYGDYVQAAKNFKQAERLLGQQGWTQAQLGMIAFLKGDMKKADELFTKAESYELNSVEFLYNFSKVKYELLELVESTELYEAARKKDSELAMQLQKREEELGSKNINTFAELHLPLDVLFNSAQIPIYGMKHRQEGIANMLMQGLKLWYIVGAGILLIVIFLLFSDKKSPTRLQTYYSDFESPKLLGNLFKLIPGTAWGFAGKPVRGFLILSLFVLLCMPLLQWPADISGVLDLLADMKIYYIASIIILTVVIDYFGFYLSWED